MSTAGAEQAIGADFAQVYRGSKLFQENERLIERLSVPPPGAQPLHFAHKHAQGVFTQFSMIFWKCASTHALFPVPFCFPACSQRLQQHQAAARKGSLVLLVGCTLGSKGLSCTGACLRFWQSYWRNVPYNGTRFIFATVLALLFGSILWDVANKRCSCCIPSRPACSCSLVSVSIISPSNLLNVCMHAGPKQEQHPGRGQHPWRAVPLHALPGHHQLQDHTVRHPALASQTRLRAGSS